MACIGNDDGIHFESSSARWVVFLNLWSRFSPFVRCITILRSTSTTPGDRYLLSAQLPGMTPADIDLTITGETLTMRGERKRAEGVKDDSYRRQERPMGRWARTITLPDRVDSAQVGASFSDGILTVSLPKAEDAKPRHITVTAAGAASAEGPDSACSPRNTQLDRINHSRELRNDEPEQSDNSSEGRDGAAPAWSSGGG